MDAPKYNLIYADPPWQYRDACKSGKRGAGFKYPTMKVEEICRLPVWELADQQSCLLAMWWVPTMVEEALAVMKAWGFRLMTMKGFTWHKTNVRAGTTAMGMGHMTRANTEDCLFAVRGRMPKRMAGNIIQHFSAPRLEHSAKPPVVREKLESLLGNVPRIELFCRGSVEGWDTWGNQAETNNVEFQPARAVIPFDWKNPASPWHPSKHATLPYCPQEGGISDAFALLEKKTMDDFCEGRLIDGVPRRCPRCNELTRVEYHTCAIPK